MRPPQPDESELKLDAGFLIGRILFSLVFIASGVMAHFVQGKETAEYARAYNAPAPETMVPLAGVMIVLGGLSVMFGLWADVGAILLVLFLVPTTFIMHAFWKEQDPQAEQMQMAMFMKNTALTGGALIVLFLYDAYGDDAPVSLTGPLLFG